MKTTVLSGLFCLIFSSAFSQNPSYQQKLYYTCKVWGFVKYYHSEVSICQVNWDSVLLATLPQVSNAVTEDDFNDALDSMLQAAGPMAIAVTPFPDTLATELKRNRDWTWWNGDTILRSDIKVVLDTIKNNFRPHPMCQVDYNYLCCNNPSYGALAFQYDFPMVNANTNMNFPNEWNRLLMFFTHWNIIKYFNPYNYVSDTPWDFTLLNYVIPIANVLNGNELFKIQKKYLATLNDAHVEEFTYKPASPFPGDYSAKVKLKYAQGKYIVTKSGFTNVNIGDEVISVNGLTTLQWEDSLAPYTSYGDSSVLRRYVCQNMISGPINSVGTLTLKDSLNNTYIRTYTCNTSPWSSWFIVYPNDTLENIKWKKWSCNVGYVNMGEILSSDVNAMYADLQNTDAIIFELRTYPNGTFGTIAGLMYPVLTTPVKVMLPDVSYPGTYYWVNVNVPASSSPYNGRVILLMDEVTQSEAEYSAMWFEAMPNSVKVGSHTAGTDGNLTYLKPFMDIYSGFTSYGIFYPNGDSTQRIGIVPDSLIYPTQIGIRHGRDELLEKALIIAGCFTSIEEQEEESQQTIQIFPNPGNNSIQLVAHDIKNDVMDIRLVDVTGRTLLEQKIAFNNQGVSDRVEVSMLPAGIYFLSLESGVGSVSTKFVKE